MAAVRLVPFVVTIPEDQRDTALKERLLKEREGILCWLVQGCLAWQEKGLEEPAAVKAATADYRSEQDVLGDFLAERCKVHREFRILTGELYATFEAWADRAGETAMKKRAFGVALREKGSRPIKGPAGGGSGLGWRWWMRNEWHERHKWHDFGHKRRAGAH